ncbi:SET domain-containing protein 8 [Daldinia childiae]|uniref:SET domain-containing protein 8 n=1 Tax=Daldinia childiae TaxID=326645 RepID=UPI00144736DA|nr:SET domain-containing protein 8 [Daldinia childiae]KAF3058671.1 SET domain-containing protein 8 [Daldinia childiae]
MRRGHFSLNELPAWSTLNGVNFLDVIVASINGRGNGLVAKKDLISQESDSEPLTLLTIPKELVLSAEGVEEYAKENKYFRQLLDTAGRQSARGDILLFLLYQLVLSSPDYQAGLGPSTPWTQYFSLLPSHVSTPTMWSELELSYLKGTSLDSAVAAKLTVLTKEFDDLRENMATLPYWNDILSIDESITIRDWILLDALYRSRSLGLPKSGESMVPCLDLVNHSSQATAYFDENSEDEVVLYLRKGGLVPAGSEITIDYGQEKSPAEMLFSYGFIDPNSAARSITLPLEPLEDDPLAIPKLHAFGTPPKLKLEEDESGVPHWTAPFVYLMCLNEEDGLRFRVLQETDGSRHLKIFWQNIDVTDVSNTMKDLIQDHELRQIFELRAVTVIMGIIQQQLEQLISAQNGDSVAGRASTKVYQAISQLRSLETSILQKSIQALDEQRDQLLRDDTVVEYLTMMGSDQNDPGAEAATDEEDFS